MFAFALLGTAMAARWDAPAIPYWIAPDVAVPGVEDDAVQAEIDKSFEAWQGVDCSDLVFPYEGRNKDAVFGDPSDGRNTVFVVTKNWPGKKGDPFALALDIDGDVIQEGDIALNAVDITFGVGGDGKTTYDLQSTAAHAIGLMLGLEESTDNGATMNPNMVGRAEGGDLADSDEAALCALYPQPTDKGPEVPPPSEQNDACTSAEDCTDGFVCVVDNGDEYCATRCGTDGECPSGTSCEDPGSGSPVCIKDRETGCAVAPRTSAGFLGLALAALALRARTRR
jgi:hypothetical protein